MRVLLLLLTFWSAWLYAEECADIWPRAVTEYSAVPASVSYAPANPTSISSFSGQFGPGDYTTGSRVIPNNTVLTTTGATTRIFVNGDLQLNNSVLLNASGPPENLLIVVTGNLTVFNNSVIRGFVLVGGAVFFSNNASINGGLTAKGDISGWNNSNATYNAAALGRLDGGVVCGATLSCFNDDFQAGSLNLSNWSVSRSSGSYTPAINNGRLRMTENVGNQSTAASFQRLFPGDQNLVVVEFNQYAYGRTGAEGADGMAVVLSDAAITPQPGAFGGPLGYGVKPGIAGFAGGWLGIGLDEYGNFSAEGGPNSPGRRKQSVALRGSGSGSSGYRYLAGTCNNGTTNTNTDCLSPTVDNNNNAAHRYRVTIDSRLSGQAMVKVERRVSGTYQTLINNFNVLTATGQSQVPDKFILSVTGSTGGSNNIHELDDLQICALRSEPVGEQIDHFEFVYSGQPLTCKNETFTIKACKNPACTELVTGTVTATLSPTSGWVSGTGLSGNVITFSGGSATATLQQTTPATVKVGVTSSMPMTKPLSTTLCHNGSTLSAANCNLTFADAGLVFEVPDKLAGKPENGIKVKAVKTADNTQQCVPAFANVSRTVRFWSDYVSPATPVASPLRAVTVAGQNIGTGFATGLDLPLSFNASGEATIAVNYSDAGQLRLNARYTGSVATADNGLVLNGADLFVSYPAGLCLQAPVHCAVADENCAVLTKAGVNFNTTISAHGWQSDTDSNFCDNSSTPSFSLNNIPLQHKVLAPAAAIGGVTGNLTPGQYNHPASASASTTVAVNIDEVGVFHLGSNELSNLSYLGVSIKLKSSMPNAAPALGRLVPASFVLASSSVAPACGNFSYMNQYAKLNFELEARNQLGAVTNNYLGSFAKATATLVAENNNDGVDRSNRLISGNPPLPKLLNWNAGKASQLTLPVTFSRLAVPATTPSTALPDGPFQQFKLGVMLNDNDGAVTKLDALDLNTSTTADCVAAANCSAKVLHTSNLDWRYGRLQLMNALGSEQHNLPVQLRAEYFNGSLFVHNAQDSCSPVEAARLIIDSTGRPVITASGNTATLQQGLSSAFDLLLGAPGVESRYPLEYQLSDAPWLQYDWDPNNGPTLENPKAEAVFGSFRGNNRQIFWREN